MSDRPPFEAKSAASLTFFRFSPSIRNQNFTSTPEEPKTFAAMIGAIQHKAIGFPAW